ncbi:peptide deformylase [Kordiimonas pumila]|uniref:Peptide deformylase-like n=1 Tax=Kordiimonas pumila TaxID=2161677 RepID=A0ABV7D293_9PROT|nr:peptide deformylase [Kordiimonas pumila]
MPALPLILGPDPILRKKSLPVEVVTDDTKKNIQDMLDTLYEHRAVGLGANMVGILEQIIVVDLQQEGKKSPLVCINPIITWQSDTKTTQEEASLCFPGISAEITRPDAVHVRYLDLEGKDQSLDAEGFLATVIQHEMDYLQGKTYLDHLSKIKRDILIKKMQKQLRNHSCGDPGCDHDHH